MILEFMPFVGIHYIRLCKSSSYITCKFETDMSTIDYNANAILSKWIRPRQHNQFESASG